MTPIDLILFVADGLRAGTLQALPLGTASIRELEPSFVSITDLDKPMTLPSEFIFECDVTIVRTKPEGSL